MLQKIIIILFAIVLILFNSVGKERINRKLLIFLSSIIVLNAILLIVRQVTGKEMELFSFLAIENDSGPILIIRLILEVVISLAILVTQALMDYPGAISQLVRYNLWRGIFFTLLYLVIANLACRKWQRTTEE